MARVYVVNKSSHDFSDAERFGEIIYLSTGSMVRFAVNSMARRFQRILQHSEKGDYILLSGLSVMNSIACSVFTHKHGRLNLLLFREGRYYEKNLVFDDDSV